MIETCHNMHQEINIALIIYHRVNVSNSISDDDDDDDDDNNNNNNNNNNLMS